MLLACADITRFQGGAGGCKEIVSGEGKEMGGGGGGGVKGAKRIESALTCICCGSCSSTCTAVASLVKSSRSFMGRTRTTTCIKAKLNKACDADTVYLTSAIDSDIDIGFDSDVQIEMDNETGNGTDKTRQVMKGNCAQGSTTGSF